MYQELVSAYIATRPALDNLTEQQLIQEQTVRQVLLAPAVLAPGSISQLPYAEKDPYLVILWIYPAPLTAVQVAAQDDDIEEDYAESAPCDVQKIKGLSRLNWIGHKTKTSIRTSAAPLNIWILLRWQNNAEPAPQNLSLILIYQHLTQTIWR